MSESKRKEDKANVSVIDDYLLWYILEVDLKYPQEPPDLRNRHHVLAEHLSVNQTF